MEAENPIFNFDLYEKFYYHPFHNTLIVFFAFLSEFAFFSISRGVYWFGHFSASVASVFI